MSNNFHVTSQEAEQLEASLKAYQRKFYNERQRARRAKKKESSMLSTCLDCADDEDEGELCLSGKTKKASMCWGCERAARGERSGCTWAAMFKPVAGWDAVYNQSTKGYCVLDCPKFIANIRKTSDPIIVRG